MKIPYSQVHVSGGIIFAARSGQIHTFSLESRGLLDTWKHPDVFKVTNALEESAVEAEDAEPADHPEESEPPAKRQRTISDEDVSTSKVSERNPNTGEEPRDIIEESGRKGKRAKGKRQGKTQRIHSSVPDRPIVTHLISTNDGKYLLAVTGHDKTVWVFEHDGEGRIKVLAQRAMPKRPSAVRITADLQIFCADKFGDVYALPLIPEDGVVSAAARRQPKAPYQTSANELTVHSKRNLMALQAQKKQEERSRLKAEAEKDGKPEEPTFELTMLLGHVSMLTALLVAEYNGKNYIITGDRDEHIRVSRSTPQAHIIETFCLGHKEFIGDLVIPDSRKDVLISGGGDPDLFVWDWLAGNIMTKTSVLEIAQKIKPEVSNVAVSHLYSLEFPAEPENLTYVLAICEDIKAIFSWQLTGENILNHPGAIQLPGNPLALEIISSEGEPPKLLVAIDTGDEAALKSLNIFTLVMNEGRLAVDSTSHVEEGSGDTKDLEASEQEIRNLLYGVENLRKQIGGLPGAPGAGDEETADIEAIGE